MKKLLSLLLFISCASDSLIEPRMIEGGRPGQPITVDIAGVTPRGPLMSPARMFEIDVEVMNLSHAPVTVSAVNLFGRGRESTLIFDPINHRANEMIDPGARASFELQTLGRSTHALRSGQRAVASVRIIVELTNGESYYYDYVIPYQEE